MIVICFAVFGLALFARNQFAYVAEVDKDEFSYRFFATLFPRKKNKAAAAENSAVAGIAPISQVELASAATSLSNATFVPILFSYFYIARYVYLSKLQFL